VLIFLFYYINIGILGSIDVQFECQLDHRGYTGGHGHLLGVSDESLTVLTTRIRTQDANEPEMEAV